MPKQVIYKPFEPIKKKDFSYIPKIDYPPYNDVGVSYQGFSKESGQSGGYTLNPQEPVVINWDEGDTHDIPSNKRLFVTGIYVAFASDLVGASFGQFKLSVQCDGTWGTTGFTNQEIIVVPFWSNQTTMNTSQNAFISFNPPVPVRIGTRTIHFEGSGGALDGYSGILTGFYDKEVELLSDN